ncbi:MBL fold metallo-hydrolase [Natribacillus halophilus]|uniref:Glyoxylase, beta-lactamase superfamily II n=1 Tax=Natribacillus halophilus TaxID=549003 RepID=A0A1G8J853_9BACI|nr:MBL fold metallo-hydrolase [Natribacillus halophilus]SDI26820.1 Glyoxylase, beta-lactamase superfamily II [Natribacillus halophilus]
MKIENIGDLELIEGRRNSKVPYSTSILVKGKNGKGDALVDIGTGKEGYEYINENHDIQDIFITHYHLDHVKGIPYFQNANIYVNEIDEHKLNDMEVLGKAMGTYALHGASVVNQWIEHNKNSQPFADIMKRDKNLYPYDQTINVAGHDVQMLYAPGHCESYCCPYFPDEGVLVVGDYDLTSFGPWYNNADSDIDAFITSGEMTLNVDADYYVTFHHKGTFTRKEYEVALERYLAIIEERERKIIQLLKEGTAIEDLIHREVFYMKRNLEMAPLLLEFEIMGVAKHLKRLAKQNNYYEDHYQSFLDHHFAEPAYSDYFVQNE